MDQDGFLLTMAAISNLTFLELTSIELLRAYGTIGRIISAVQSKTDFSIFIKDHVSTQTHTYSSQDQYSRRSSRINRTQVVFVETD